MGIAHLNELIGETELIPQERYANQRAKEPVLANLNKLHAKEIKRFFKFAPQLRMSWADYDKFIGRDNLCIYDLLCRAAHDKFFASFSGRNVRPTSSMQLSDCMGRSWLPSSTNKASSPSV